MKPLLLSLSLLAALSMSSVQAGPRPVPYQQPICAPGVSDLSRRVAVLLKNNDTRALSRLVDARRGLRITPQAYIAKEDVHLNRAQVASMRNSKTIRTWGTYDGEGGDIRLNWANYRKRFVWKRDFSRGAKLTVNGKPKGRSTVINNLRSSYPNTTLVEFYLPPTSPDALDWASLWMAWRKTSYGWRLIGIANDQWST